MTLLPDDIKAQLIHNNVTARDTDHVPVVKLFLPGTGCTWLLTEMEPDGTCFGLCDLGMGEPELGYVSIEELESVRSRLGLGVERDLHWSTSAPLSQYAAAARASGRIVDTH